MISIVMLLTLWICALLYNAAEAGSTCFCSATGDPHIRSFSGATSNVGAGQFTLASAKHKFSVELIVTQTSATLTQIAEVNVKLAGDQPEQMDGYGMIHRADGIEIRVLSNNNVFIIWDASKITGVSENTLCGGTCPDAQEDVVIQEKIEKLEKEYELQHNQAANLILEQVKSEIQIDEIVRKMAQLKKQGAKTDALILEMENIVNGVSRRRRRSADTESADEVAHEEVLKKLEQERKEVLEDSTALEELGTGEFGFGHTQENVEAGAAAIKTSGFDGMGPATVVNVVGEEVKHQSKEMSELYEQQAVTGKRLKRMINETVALLQKETEVQRSVKRMVSIFKKHEGKILECIKEDHSFPTCFKKFNKRDR